MRVLVTGASGFVGTAMLRRLLQEPRCEVRAAVRRVDVPLPSGVARAIVPVVGPDTPWSEALAGCDAVIHLAARVHVMDDQASDPLSEFRRTNVQGTLALAQQAARAGVRRFVHVSSIKVNGEATRVGQAFGPDDPPMPQDPYAVSKLEAETGLRRMDTGMEVAIVRPPLVYGDGVQGNFNSLMRAVSRGLPLPLGAIHNRRSFVALENLVDFLLVCCRHPAAAHQTFLVSDDYDLSTTELIQRLANALGSPLRLLPVPVAWLTGAAAVFGGSATVQRLCANLQLDISKSRTQLAWTPPQSVDDALRRAANGFRV